MAQPDDYEWENTGRAEWRCYPSGVKRPDRPFLAVHSVLSKLLGPNGKPAVIWGAWWVEPADAQRGVPLRLSVDGVNFWPSAQAARAAATGWHRHVVESYDGQHDVELQRRGYRIVPEC